jgi:hypothetical protein
VFADLDIMLVHIGFDSIPEPTLSDLFSAGAPILIDVAEGSKFELADRAYLRMAPEEHS